MQQPESVIEPTGNRLPAPEGLGEAGRTMWEALQADYDLRDGQALVLLRVACECADRMADAAAIIRSEGYVVAGTRGPQTHPAVRVIASAEATMLRALRALALPLPELHK